MRQRQHVYPLKQAQLWQPSPFKQLHGRAAQFIVFNRNYDYGLQRLRKQCNRNKTIIFVLLLLLVELYFKFRVVNCSKHTVQHYVLQ